MMQGSVKSENFIFSQILLFLMSLESSQFLLKRWRFINLKMI